MRGVWGLLAVLSVLTACATSSTKTPRTSAAPISPDSVTSAPTSTRPGTARTSAAALKVTTAPCPLLAEPAAKVILGVTLSRDTTLIRGGRPVGCQFFATQGRTTGSNETLPGPNQPILSFSSASYASALLADNALVRQAAAGAQEAQYDLPSGQLGAVYKVTFDPADGARNDWAYAFVIDDRVVTITTALINDSLSAREVGAAIAPKY